MPKTRHSYGVYAWDQTNQYYTACLKWHISFAMTPDEVHDLGLKEIARISADMKKVLLLLLACQNFVCLRNKSEYTKERIA